jgi:hypothetical protein
LTRWTHWWWWRPGAKIYVLVLDCTENMNDDREDSTLNLGWEKPEDVNLHFTKEIKPAGINQSEKDKNR